VYRFKLESVLEHRRRVEENLQRRLAEAVRLLGAERARLEGLSSERAGCQQELARRQAELVNPRAIPLYFHYLAALDGRIARQRERVAQAHKHRDQRRRELLAGMQKRKILDKLKEKGAADHLRESDRRERDFADEVAIARHVRR
jgi:flagellar FliJ protein